MSKYQELPLEKHEGLTFLRKRSMFHLNKLSTYGGKRPMGQELKTHAEERIMERLKKVPRRQLHEVIQFIDSIVERQHMKTGAFKGDDIKRSILDLRGRGKGERLVEKLLRSRREDKRIDERK